MLHLTWNEPSDHQDDEATEDAFKTNLGKQTFSYTNHDCYFFIIFFLIHFSIYIEIFQCCLYLLWTIGAHSVQGSTQCPFFVPAAWTRTQTVAMHIIISICIINQNAESIEQSYTLAN